MLGVCVIRRETGSNGLARKRGQVPFSFTSDNSINTAPSNGL